MPPSRRPVSLIGLAGAFGVARGGRLVGLVRDRVVLIGKRADGPVDVDSIDEMLFIAPRRVLEALAARIRLCTRRRTDLEGRSLRPRRHPVAHRRRARRGVDPRLIVNLDRSGAFVDDDPDPLVLTRLGFEIHVTSGGPDQAVAAIRAAPAGSSVPLSGLWLRDLRAVSPHLSRTRPLLGYRREVGYWLVVGPRVAQLAARLRSRRSAPAGMGRNTT